MTSFRTVPERRQIGSWWSRARPVKQGYSEGGTALRWNRLGRQLEGWPFAVVSLGLAFLGLGLGGVRPVEPEIVPPPFVDARQMRRTAERREALARLAVFRPLPFEVRAVGEQVRRYGLAEAGDTDGIADQLGRELAELAARATRTAGTEALLELRAVQIELFLAALLRWEATRHIDQDLLELGGDFVERAESSGWTQGRLLLTTDERAVLFLVRWGRLTQLFDDPEFAPTQNEWRVYYRVLLDHPERGSSGVRDGMIDRQLEVVRALDTQDPAYPAAFARGVLLYRRGEHGAALGAFQSYLAEFGDGRWQLRARNHLRSCIPAGRP